MADGSQITKSKPDPEVFRLAARKLRLSPDECAVVEDASAGILAANAGGFFPIGLGTPPRPRLPRRPKRSV
ncbi:HAD-IA family hydrolase [Flavonifractor plautii]|nr:HAD-IA family hydrolase [Flavonifractor plautii]